MIKEIHLGKAHFYKKMRKLKIKIKILKQNKFNNLSNFF